jgi:Fe2+ transport system protein B
MVFMLNKADLAEPSDANLKDIRTLASEKSIPVLATSAKTGLNVEMAFQRLGRLMVEAWANKKFGKKPADQLLRPQAGQDAHPG